MITSFKSRVLALFVVALMVLSAVALPAMAAVTYDTETTATSTTSDWQQDTTVTDLDNSSKMATIEVQSDNATSGDDFTLDIVVNDTESDQDNVTVYETDESWTATNETAGYYEVNLTHSEVFEHLQRGAGENVTVDVITTVNESESSEESATIQIHAQNGEGTAVIVANDGDAGLETSNETGSRFPISMSSLNPFSDDDDDEPGAAQITESTAVNASSTDTVRVELVNTSAADAGSEVASTVSSGDFIGIASGEQDGTFYPMFAEDASDVEWIDTASDSYVTLDSNGDTVTYHNVNETVDSDGNIEFSTTVNDGLGFRNAWSMLETYDVSIFERISFAQDSSNFNGNPFEDD